jgi:hypothetical protein
MIPGALLESVPMQVLRAAVLLMFAGAAAVFGLAGWLWLRQPAAPQPAFSAPCGRAR